MNDQSNQAGAQAVTHDDIKCLHSEITKCHGNFMAMAGFYKDANGQWIGGIHRLGNRNKSTRSDAVYTGHAPEANGVFAALAILEDLMRKRGIAFTRA